MKKIMKILFIITLIILPICSVKILPKIFFKWSSNLAILPFSILFILTIIYVIVKKISYKGVTDNTYKSKQIINISLLFVTYIIINSLIMSFIIINFGNSLYNDILMKKLISDLILEVIFPCIVVIISVINIELFSIRSTIKTVILGMFICCIVYGYIQIIAVNVRHGFIYEIYSIISKNIDFIWGIDTPYQYAYQTWRLNLTTPESSEAGAIITIVLIPFLFSSIISGVSIFKSKFLKIIKYETLILILLTPIIYFIASSSAYVIVLIQLIFLCILKLFKEKKAIKRLGIVAVILLSISIIMYISIVNNPSAYVKIDYYINKLSDLNEISTSSRLGLIVSEIKSFFSFPINGCGFSNTNIFIIKNLPNWSLNSEILYNLYSNPLWFVGVRSMRLLMSCGIIGIAFMVIILKKIYKFIKINKYTKLGSYIFYSYVIYLVGSILEGFNSSTFSFIYLWVMLAIFIVASNELLGDERSD